MECLRRDAITTPLGGTNNMADDGRSWQSSWHGYMNKLDPIASDRYVDNLRLVGLSEDGDPLKLWSCER